MGLLDFLFGTNKLDKATVHRMQNNAYNKGYYGGRNDSYEDFICECEEPDECHEEYETGQGFYGYDDDCHYGEYECDGTYEDNSPEW